MSINAFHNVSPVQNAFSLQNLLTVNLVSQEYLCFHSIIIDLFFYEGLNCESLNKGNVWTCSCLRTVDKVSSLEFCCIKTSVIIVKDQVDDFTDFTHYGLFLNETNVQWYQDLFVTLVYLINYSESNMKELKYYLMNHWSALKLLSGGDV